MRHLAVKPFDWLCALGQGVPRLLGYLTVGSVAVVMASTFMACQFNPPGLDDGVCGPNCDYNDGTWLPEEIDLLVDTAPLTTLKEGNRKQNTNGVDVTAFSSYHGYGCASAQRAHVELPKGDDVVGIHIEDSIPLPSSTYDGMVYLNGWSLKYNSSDHKVQGLGVWIFDVHREETLSGVALRWKAGGALADQDGNDAYTLCYHYTVAMWDTNHIAASVATLDASPSGRRDKIFVTRKAETDNLRVLSGAWGGLEQPKAVVPLGFGFKFDGRVDHNILQIGFELDAKTFFTRLQGNNTISWDSTGILKDNSEHAFIGAEMASVIEGPGVEVAKKWWTESPRYLWPRTPSQCPSQGQPVTRTEWITLPGLPYDHAVPILAGWDIGDICDDNHVTEIGARIESFMYRRDPGAATGTLNVTISSVFRDQDSRPGMAYPRYKINVLGFSRN
jgi:hypothetical protein